MKYTLEQLRGAHERLPEDIKVAIDSADSSEIMLELRKRHSLTIEQMGYIADETGFALLGLTHPRDFVGNIKSKLGVDESVAQDITKEINEQIFAPIKDSLMGLHSQAKVSTVTPTEKVESIEDKYREPTEVAPKETSKIPAVKEALLEPEIKDGLSVTGQPNTEQVQDTVPSKEDLLKEIEGVPDTTSAEKPIPTIQEAKSPAEEEDLISNKLGSKTNIPSKESAPVTEKDEKDAVDIGYAGVDPYKEPLD